MSVIPLTYSDLLLAATLVLLLAGSSFALSLGISRDLLIGALRTVIQLLLVGLVLKVLFAHASLLWISAMAALMVAVATREVYARQSRPLAGGWGLGVSAVPLFVSSFTLTAIALVVIISPQPWYLPQYAIPLLGMVLGNAMTAVALGLDRLTSSAFQQRGQIEARLALGQTWRQAMSGLQRESARIALVPVINAMAAAGVVSLPGMMTGQILSGTPPMEAVKYQILIMFLIAAATGLAALLAISGAARRLFDERQRLRLDRLRAPR